jgi:TolA-binding protein
VAARLACPRGTVAAHLARARERLRGRLVRRGVTLSAAALAAALAEAVAASPVPAALVARAGQAVAAGAVPAGAAALANGVLRGMAMAKLKVAAVALAVGLAGTAGGVAAWQARAADTAAPKEVAAKSAVEADADRLLFLAGSLHFLVEEDYRAAERAFSLLLKKYPDSRFAPKSAELAVLAKQLTTRGDDARKANGGRRAIEAALAAERKDIEAQQAEKDFAIAEFYRRTSHPGAACFYYETVRRRYPGTPFAEKAEARMRELLAKTEVPPRTEKPPARVGQIFIIGNDKTPQGVILDQAPLYPGALLTAADLLSAQKNLARTGRFVVDPDKGVWPTVTVREDPRHPDSEFKDISSP